MSSFKKIVCSLIISCAAGAPVFAASEQYIAVIPDSWTKAFEDEKGSLQIAEYVPPGQSIEDWKQMMTTQVYSGGVSKSPREFVESIAVEAKAVCPNLNSKLIRDGEENGYKFAFINIVCPHNTKTGKGEVAFIKATEGEKALYVTQHAWKTDLFELPSMPVPLDEISRWSATLSKMKACNDGLSGRECAPVWEGIKHISFPVLTKK